MEEEELELATASPPVGGQLPLSTYTPLEVEQLDGRELRAWLDSISERLEEIKRDFAALYGEPSAPRPEC